MVEAFKNNESLIKFEIKENTNLEETFLQQVEIEILPPVDVNDKRKVKIYREISKIDERLDVISERVNELNSKIDSLTNQTDGLDYTIAVASGIITGIIDSVWVGEFSIERANDWGDEKTENFVVQIAQKQGYEKDDLPGAIRCLEKKFPIVADEATNAFGGGRQHHLRDFSHHPTPIGLLFSLLTQFTGYAYGTDTVGNFLKVDVKGSLLLGKNLPEQITFGLIHWFFHMVSDMAGSSSSALKESAGTGLPGPLVSLLKEMSAFPIFKKMNEKGYKEISVWISKLFNGTLLGKRDDAGKIQEPIKFDLRTEVGIVNEIGRQAVPVVINECIVRGFYFLRHLYQELKENNVKTFGELKDINWKNTVPFNSRTIARMLTISTGTFMAFDIADATIRSGGFNGNCILRINFVGVGRFAIAIGTDTVMGINKLVKENERTRLTTERLKLMNAKVCYKEADMWMEAEKAGKSINEVHNILSESTQKCLMTWVDIAENLESISDSLKKEREEDALLETFMDMLFEN